MKDAAAAVRSLTHTALLADFSLTLSWSLEEAARYIGSFPFSLEFAHNISCTHSLTYTLITHHSHYPLRMLYRLQHVYEFHPHLLTHTHSHTETFKAYERKGSEMIEERLSTDSRERAVAFLTAVPTINKTDAATLLRCEGAGGRERE